MYSRVCLLCIIVTLSLGHIASKAGVEENDKIFSLNFEVINPRDKNCELMGNTSKCEVELSAKNINLENIDHGFRYIVPIKIGEHGFRVQLDTGSNVLWVMTTLCKNCGDNHNKYPLDKKTGRESKKFSFEYLGGGIGGVIAENTVQLEKGIIIKKQIFGAACIIRTTITDFDGVMGINMATFEGFPSVFYSMIEQKIIKEPIYSIYLIGGASAKNGGMITFGGRNDDLFVENTAIKTPIIAGDGRAMIEMTSLSLGKEKEQEFFCSKDIKTCTVIVDTGGSEIFVTREAMIKIYKILEPTGEHHEVDCKKVEDAPTFEILFGEQKLTLEPTFYTFKFHTGKCYTTVVENPSKDSDWQFGVPFFVKFYIEFNFTEKQESITFWTKK